jgi:hypothetical protein
MRPVLSVPAENTLFPSYSTVRTGPGSTSENDKYFVPTNSQDWSVVLHHGLSLCLTIGTDFVNPDLSQRQRLNCCFRDSKL